MIRVNRNYVWNAYLKWFHLIKHVPMNNNSWVEFWKFLGRDDCHSKIILDGKYNITPEEHEMIGKILGEYGETFIRAKIARMYEGNDEDGG
jgi:hypothetical protein